MSPKDYFKTAYPLCLKMECFFFVSIFECSSTRQVFSLSERVGTEMLSDERD